MSDGTAVSADVFVHNDTEITCTRGTVAGHAPYLLLKIGESNTKMTLFIDIKDVERLMRVITDVVRGKPANAAP